MEKNLGWSAAKYSELVGFESDWRDTWWNQDYLELLARRLDFAGAKRVLDVGCGAGHWGQRIATLLGDDARIDGVDHEGGFLEAARKRAAKRLGVDRCVYQEASAEALPFEDDTFDLVTCQTVLIHVPDVDQALREMLRVLRPGGLLLVAEPNNLVNALVNRVALPAPRPDELLQLLAFEDTCLRGKIALGHGDSAVGDRLPALFTSLGLEDIAVSSNDRCPALVAPYDTPAARSFVEQTLKSVEAKISRWGDEPTAKRLFIAGGGDAQAFDEIWALELAEQARMKSDLESGRLVWGGGFLMFAVSGRKPATR